MKELGEKLMGIVEEIREGKGGKRSRKVRWWDECKKTKRGERKAMRERKGKVKEEEYRRRN